MLGAELARALVGVLAAHVEGLGGEAPVGEGELLEAVLQLLPTGEGKSLPPPRIPLLDTTLLTNAPDEPRVGGCG